MGENNSLLANIKILQEKTGLSLQDCKNALNQSNDIDQALIWLRENKMIQSLSKKDILDKCSLNAVEWAKSFLKKALDSKNLKEYYERDEININRDDYFSNCVIGVPGTCPFLIYKNDLKYLTNKEKLEFEKEVKELYDNSVEHLLPDYIQPDWKIRKKNPLLESIKILQEKTGLSLQDCKTALDQSNNDIDQALLWFRENNMIQSFSKDEIINKCALYAVEWAKNFLDTTLETGELKKYYESGKIDIIQENYFLWYIVGMPGICPFLIFKNELNSMTYKEKEEFNDEVIELYDNAVERFLPEYIKPDWKSSKQGNKL